MLMILKTNTGERVHISIINDTVLPVEKKENISVVYSKYK
jgi:hypothetical protein